LTGSFDITENITISPVGYVRSPLKARYETPHQGVLEKEHESVIELVPGSNFEQALRGLTGFSRIWVVYRFHLNDSWKPMVTPPKNNGMKVGVFASRSPHRPNQIGLSCVRMIRTEGLKIYIAESDILDGTPVLDIKPYLPYSDSFPDASTGWVAGKSSHQFKVIFSQQAEADALHIKEETTHDLINYARVQLSTEPGNLRRKRISPEPYSGMNHQSYSLAYRKWKIIYTLDETASAVTVLTITETPDSK
jgi:tRNA-Thr(GGU) m(6)t(6)A37 methyltransferase TsaA